VRQNDAVTAPTTPAQPEQPVGLGWPVDPDVSRETEPDATPAGLGWPTLPPVEGS